ncbi:MAG: hypothetical protein DRN92_02630 [Thermoproteota archaeon]|nr:MAG: hypothetical protein DRN92_02630 [Candidatus Korarchaeota archaeon]
MPKKFTLFSGGKDSSVVLHLMKDCIDSAVYVDTGIALPENNKFVESLCEEFGVDLIILKPEIDFWEYVKTAGFPTIRSLWCRYYLKIEPLRKFFRSIKPPAITYLGIRLAESSQRRKFYSSNTSFSSIRNMKLRFDEKTNTWQFFPILEWSDIQVKRYLKEQRIKINPCYKLYGFSSCYFCPFIRKREFYLKLKARHPDLFSKIIKAERSLRSKGSALLTPDGKPLLISDIDRQTFLDSA